MVIVLRAVSPCVCIVVLDGLEAGEGVLKDPHPFVRGELVQGRIYGHQFRPHDILGFVCAPCIDVDGCAGGNMYHWSP